MPNGENFNTRTGNLDIDGLLIGTRWDSSNLTYYFPTASTGYTIPYEIDPGNFDNTYVSNFIAFNAAWQAAASAALTNYSAVSGLSFTLGSDIASSDIVFAQTSSSSVPTANARFPGYTANEGHEWYRDTNYATPEVGNYTFHTLLHETGHAMGLAHSHSADSITAVTGQMVTSEHDNMEFTVMSYRSYENQYIAGYTNETYGFAQSLMMDDIAAIQYLYGANFLHNSSATTYTFSQSTGEMFINGVGQGAPGANRIFATIWDGNGNDTYDLSNYTTDLDIDLSPGGWSTFDVSQLALLGHNNYARANIYNALLYNNNQSSLIENAIGGIGNDRLVGNQGANTLTGNNGQDILIGGGGDDYLYGGNQDDVLWGDDNSAANHVSGVGMGAGVYSHGSIHDTAGTAYDVTNLFSTASNANIENSTTIPHVTMSYSGGAGDTQAQYYSIVLNADSQVTLDIDNASFDTVLTIYAADGTTILRTGDDIRDVDTGSSSTQDSWISVRVPSTGTYYVAVGSYNAPAVVPASGSYDLHISVADPDVLGNDGAAGNDVLYGGYGSDTLHGGEGVNYLFGDDGSDTGVMEGTSAQHSIVRFGDDVYVFEIGTTNRNALYSIETIQFDDQSFASTMPADNNIYSYMASHTDLINAFGSTVQAAEIHYFDHGYYELRALDTFDEYSYIASHADLLSVFSSGNNGGGDGATAHYVTHGFGEGRELDTFDENSYIASHADLLSVFGSGNNGGGLGATAHYVNNGYSEGRALDSFDEVSYLASHADLLAVFGNDGAAATAHYVNYGFGEGRALDTFDEYQYVASYADLIGVFGTAGIGSATAHYVDHGYGEGRVLDFNAQQYLSNYSDLQAAFGSDLLAATIHYIDYGFAEGRTDEII